MATETYPGQLEPEDPDAEVWRFMGMERLRDLLRTGELYFCRADLFADDYEGLPPRGYYPSPRLNPLDLRDREEIDHSLGSLAQFREGFYISCWHLYREETCSMWGKYGTGTDGVAICSRYGLLRRALGALEEPTYIGMVRYGPRDMEGWNLFRFIFNKREEFAEEREVRAVLWVPDPRAGINRHFDAENRAHPRPLTPPPGRVPRGQRRTVDLQALITGVRVTPFASAATLDRAIGLARTAGLKVPVHPSALTDFKGLLPCRALEGDARS